MNNPKNWENDKFYSGCNDSIIEPGTMQGAIALKAK